MMISPSSVYFAGKKKKQEIRVDSNDLTIRQKNDVWGMSEGPVIEKMTGKDQHIIIESSDPDKTAKKLRKKGIDCDYFC